MNLMEQNLQITCIINMTYTSSPINNKKVFVAYKNHLSSLSLRLVYRSYYFIYCKRNYPITKIRHIQVVKALYKLCLT